MGTVEAFCDALPRFRKAVLREPRGELYRKWGGRREDLDTGRRRSSPASRERSHRQSMDALRGELLRQALGSLRGGSDHRPWVAPRRNLLECTQEREGQVRAHARTPSVCTKGAWRRKASHSGGQ